MASELNRPVGPLDAGSALAPYRGNLDQRLAAHLLRRAGFGGTPAEIALYATMSPAFAVEQLVHTPGAAGLASPQNTYDPSDDLRSIAIEFRGVKDDPGLRAARQGVRKAMRQSILSMQLWWLNRMLTTPAPLQEKMTFFLHGHFTTAAIEKGVWPNYVWQQNQLYRTSALGNLRTLTLAVSQDPAMLRYLDNASNNKTHPNENYARELMELFTLGHGNYSEEDVRQSARAFTGWTIDRATEQFADNPRIHDDGSKTFLGQTGDLNGADIVDIIYRQPACARFWAQTLLGYFVYNDPEPALVDETAALIRKHDYELAPVMATLLRSNVFYSDRAYRALVKSPVEFVIGTHKALALASVAPTALRALNAMGQVLFRPPNVAGWPGGVSWITSQTLIARQNFVTQLVNSPAIAGDASWLVALPMNADPAARKLVASVLQGDAPDEATAQLVAYLNGSGTSALGTLSAENFEERVRGAAYLTMSMPAYQLS